MLFLRQLANKRVLNLLLALHCSLTSGLGTSSTTLHLLGQSLHLALSLHVRLGTLLHPSHFLLQGSHLGLIGLDFVGLLVSTSLHLGSKLLSLGFSSFVLLRALLVLLHLGLKLSHPLLVLGNLGCFFLLSCDSLGFSSLRDFHLAVQVLELRHGSLVRLRALLHFGHFLLQSGDARLVSTQLLLEALLDLLFSSKLSF